MTDPFFRQFFTPLQPTVKSDSGSVVYTELFPEFRLSKYIYCYWQLKSAYRLSTPFSYRVVPDACIDIFVDMNDTRESRVMGFSTGHTVFELNYSFHYVGIRFLPSAFSYFFNVDASSLSNREESLDTVAPTLAKQLSELLEGQRQFGRIKIIFDGYFLKKASAIESMVDKRLYDAIISVLKARGTINIQSDIDTGISPRQLRRLFEFHIGGSPKIFSKIVRFQYFLQLLSSSDGQRFNQLLYEAGYYDQPHFTKDFKTFFGLTPKEALSR